jgi:hypothetical protein
MNKVWKPRPRGKKVSPMLRTWLVGKSGTFRESGDDLAGLDEILIRKSVRSGTCRSEVLDTLGDLGRWYYRCYPKVNVSFYNLIFTLNHRRPKMSV